MEEEREEQQKSDVGGWWLGTEGSDRTVHWWGDRAEQRQRDAEQHAGRIQPVRGKNLRHHQDHPFELVPHGMVIKLHTKLHLNQSNLG